MDAKVSKFSELSALIDDKNQLSADLSSLFSLFRMPQILWGLKMEKEKGLSCSTVILFLMVFRICGMSIHGFFKRKFYGLLGEDQGKDVFYRLMSSEKMNWRGFLYAVAKSFKRIVSENTDEGADATAEGQKPRCIIFDDTALLKTGEHNRMENISVVHDHTTGRYCIGFKLLLCAFFDGISTIPLDFAIIREKGKKGNYGLSMKDLRKLFSKKRDEKSCGYLRDKEAEMDKPAMALQMLRETVSRGYRIDYVLYDSWFNSVNFIKEILAIGKGAIHALGMAKNNSKKYIVKGRTYTLKTMVDAKVTKQQRCAKYKCMYMKVDAEMEGIPVRLFLVKYGHANVWKTIITTDTSLSFVKAFEYYQIRWNIEVIFRECKQYLALGKCQSRDFDALIADCTLCFAVYTMMSVRKRFGEYETMGEVFHDLEEELFLATLWQRFLPIIARILARLIDCMGFDIEEVVRTMAQDTQYARDIICMLKALENQDFGNQNDSKVA